MAQETLAQRNFRRLGSRARHNCHERNGNHTYDDRNSHSAFYVLDGDVKLLVSKRPSAACEPRLDSHILFMSPLAVGTLRRVAASFFDRTV